LINTDKAVCKEAAKPAGCWRQWLSAWLEACQIQFAGNLKCVSLR
jgi:hypothetical protein